jgi:hypothetical protein
MRFEAAGVDADPKPAKTRCDRGQLKESPPGDLQ